MELDQTICPASSRIMCSKLRGTLLRHFYYAFLWCSMRSVSNFKHVSTSGWHREGDARLDGVGTHFKLFVGSIRQAQFNVHEVDYCALFARVARLNHSCCPNAFVDCSRSRAVVRALVDIKAPGAVKLSAAHFTLQYCQATAVHHVIESAHALWFTWFATADSEDALSNYISGQD